MHRLLRNRAAHVVAALLLGALVLAGCRGDDEEGAGAALAERWLRLGEESQTNVVVYERRLPPPLSDLLNPNATEDTPSDDRVAIPVHSAGDLLGSYLLRRMDGSHLVWLFYNVEDVALGTLTGEVGGQLDESPWQVVGEQASGSFTVIQFQTTTGDDISGTAILEPAPPSGAFDLVVERDGSERTLEVTRAAVLPVIEADLDDDLTVSRVYPGLASAAGLRAGDRIVRVEGEDVADQADLTRVMQGLASAIDVISVTYLMELPGPSSVVEPAFSLREGLALPNDFPLRDLWSTLTVHRYQTQVAPGGSAFAASLLTRDSSSDIVAQVRSGLEDAGWEIVSDEPVGFATALQFASDDGGLTGTAQIDLFPEDESFTQVLVQIQTAAP